MIGMQQASKKLRRSVHLCAVTCAALGLLTGCCYSTMLTRAQSEASFEHDCPKSDVRTLYANWHIYVFEFDVCGQKRTYRAFNGRLIDVTDGIPWAHPPEHKVQTEP